MSLPLLTTSRAVTCPKPKMNSTSSLTVIRTAVGDVLVAAPQAKNSPRLPFKFYM